MKVIKIPIEKDNKSKKNHTYAIECLQKRKNIMSYLVISERVHWTKTLSHLVDRMVIHNLIWVQKNKKIFLEYAEIKEIKGQI